ncbi:aminopeptidase [Bacillus sp. JJ1503]|uniref:aminopeptidase n=1 Tax=unclassified Bacillus (in: firmicutes) TaxID=185979 RepID=UPI003000A1D1
MEPPSIVAEAMKMVDVALCITENSISHTKARIEAAKHKTRVATMPGLTLDMLVEGALKADYMDVKRNGDLLAKVLDEGKEVVIKTFDKTLSFIIDGRKSKASNGLLLNPGDSGNLPSGETFLAPVEGTANGEIIIDGSIADIGKVESPILLKIKDGRLIEAEGKEGQKLLQLLGDGDGRFLGEFGIGTNRAARITGNILEDEKVYGTCHIAFGTNISFGGRINAGVHLDAVAKTPEILIDGKLIVAEGKIQL